MYNPKSLKAEEFISDEEIRETLAYADANKENVALIDQILAKAKECKGLTHREASVLLACPIPEKIQKMYDLAAEIKKEFYGNRIVLFAPLYLSNYCVNGCVYCPYHKKNQHIARKKLTQEEIVKEVKKLKEEGYLEVTLLGQNVNAYGKDLEEGYNFANLLEEVAKTEISRIRFVTSHPWDFTDEMIDIIAKYENIMPYIHLPLQSGSTRILKLMGRRYTKEEYLTLYKKIKERVKDVSITTDIIVGFPNETEEDFKETLEVVKECQFDGAFTFIYSPREGTPASKIKDNILKEEKEERLQKLNILINNDSLAHNKEYIGKIEEVLVLGPSEKGEDKVYGYTKTMKLVNVSGAKEDIGKIISVKITDAKSFSLDGEKVIFVKN